MDLVNPLVEERDVQKSMGKIESEVVTQKAKENLDSELEWIRKILSFH